MFDLISVAIIGVFMFLGLRSGLIKAALKLVGLALATIAASRYFFIGSQLIADFFNLSEGVRAVIGFVIIFVAVFLFFELIASMLKSLMRKLKLVWVDRLGGLLFGFLEGVIIMMIVVWGINLFPELGFTGRLQKSSTSFQLLSRMEIKAARGCRLDSRLDVLEKSLRKSVFLPEAPAVDSLEIPPEIR
jgi:membrane protein required for colicin V production